MITDSCRPPAHPSQSGGDPPLFPSPRNCHHFSPRRKPPEHKRNPRHPSPLSLSHVWTPASYPCFSVHLFLRIIFFGQEPTSLWISSCVSSPHLFCPQGAF